MTQFISTLRGLVGETIASATLTNNGVALRFSADRIAVLNSRSEWCDNDNCDPQLRLVRRQNELDRWEQHAIGLITQEEFDALERELRKETDAYERKEYERLKQKFETENA